MARPLGLEGPRFFTHTTQNTRDMLKPASVRVPASTSNLGAGFDTLGMAVRRYLTARYVPGTGALTLTRDGTLTELMVGTHDDLLVRAFAGELTRRGRSATGSLYVTSEIPVARGLGTSAAATVAGLLLAGVACGDAVSERESALDQAVALEGAREAGAWGATISGSGSGLIALCARDQLTPVSSAMVAAFRHAGHEEVVTFPLEPEPFGALARVMAEEKPGQAPRGGEPEADWEVGS